MNNILNKEFEESKIFERLDYQPQPKEYKGKLPWIVQQQIAGTNGIHYVDRIGKLKDYPQFEMPVKKVNTGIMLDIGCGWGRWLLSGARKGYLPIGIDLRLEFCEASLQTLHDNNTAGYVVAADLKALPFDDNVFDLVWSFSVIQHTHKDRLLNCLKEIYRVLQQEGYAKLEFPNKEGFRNSFRNANEASKTADDYNSWAVRYYSIDDYKDFFFKEFNNFTYSVHSFLGIGVLKEDLLYVSAKNKILCAASLLLTETSKLIFPLQKKADSIYIEAKKDGKRKVNPQIQRFLNAHYADSTNNLNIIHLLKCPATGSPLSLSDNSDFLLNKSKTIKYPIINKIPILIRSQGVLI